MSWFVIFVFCFIGMLYYYYRERKKQFTFFKDRGIPGPEPNIVLGNLIETQDGLSTAVHRWGQKYGKTFGYYEGPLPVLVTSDTDILRQVFVKDFHKFCARKRFAVQSSPDSDTRVHLFFSDGARWKRQRMVMNKAFSAHRLRMMTPAMHKAVSSMMEEIHSKSQESYFDIYPMLQCLTLEIIMSVGFGVDFDAQKDSDNIFLKKCRSVFTDNMPTSGKRIIFPILVALGLIFPSLNNILFKLQVFFHEKNIDPDSTLWFMDKAGEIIQERRQATRVRNDFIQLMMDVEKDSDSGSDSTETDDDSLTMTVEPNEKPSRLASNCPMFTITKKHLTFEEMKANCQLFLLAGYETTSTALAYIVYELAMNRVCQDKVHAEILDNIPEQEMVSYEASKRLKYMDMFIFETFRLHPIAPFVVGRTALEDTELQGIQIPKGQGILANVFGLQFNEVCWQEPEKFIPERFLKEMRLQRDPLYHLPFGAGPRNCIGIRFALHEIRIAITELVRQYHILPCEKTEIPIKTVEMATVVPKNGIPIRLERRT